MRNSVIITMQFSNKIYTIEFHIKHTGVNVFYQV